MKKNLFNLLCILAISIITFNSCSKEEQINVPTQESSEVGEDDMGNILASIEKQGVNISEITNESELSYKAASPLLEAYTVYELKYQDIWTSTRCKFNSTITAPNGKTFKIVFYIYSYTTNKSTLINSVLTSSWKAGKSHGLTPYYICGGNYEDIVVLALVFIGDSGTNPSTLYRLYLSNKLTGVPLSGISL